MARNKRSAQDLTTLQMALVGYELEKGKIEARIREIQAQLGGRGGKTESKGRKKRALSSAARKRISAAQKRRWAEHRRRKAQAEGK